MLGEFGRLLRAIADGPDPARIPAPQEIIPVIPLTDYEPSFAFPSGKYLFQGYALEAAGVARSHVGLVNPTRSNTVATIRRIEAFVDTDSLLLTFAPQSDTAGMDSDGAEVPRDTRLRVATVVTKNPSSYIVSDDAAQIGVAARRIFARSELTAGNYFLHETPLVLFPNAAWLIMPDANAKACYVSIDWEERHFDDQELAGIKSPVMAT